MLKLPRRRFLLIFLSIAAIFMSAHIISFLPFNSIAASNSPQCGSQLENLDQSPPSSGRNYLRIYMSCIDNNVSSGIRNGSGRGTLQPASINSIIPHTDRVVTSGQTSGGNLGFVSASTNASGNNDFLRSPLVAIGYSNVESSYSSGFDACVARGEFVIGWYGDGYGSSDNPICRDVQFRPGTLIGPSGAYNSVLAYKENSTLKMASSSELFRFYTDPYNANTSALHYYCNAHSDINGAWGTAISKYSLSGRATGIQEQIDDVQTDTCKEAEEICLERGGTQCSIVSEDVWRSNVINSFPQLRTVDLSLKCSSIQNFYQAKSGISREEIYSAFSELQDLAIRDSAQSCNFSIQYFYDILISPSQSGRTLIRAGLSEDGHVIDDLVGSVTIRQAGGDTESIVLNPGDRFLIESLDPQDPGQLSKLIVNDKRQGIVDLPVVKAFLDKSRWPNSLGSEIDAYLDALREQFLPKPPSVKVEQRIVSGVSVVVAEVDLSNPNTVFTAAQESEVGASGGLNRFASTRNAALILSGTFGRAGVIEDNWSVVSQNRFIQGADSQDWSNYTVLGIRQNNEPEMLPRSGSPNWDEYWFALTGHPRLVNGGVASVTEIAQGSNLSINDLAGRAAIGFSRGSRKLYHVITNESVSLRKMAEIMRAVGCDDAMNLEGGGGYFIVHQGQVYGPGEVRSPVIIVNDTERQPNSQLQEAWRGF